MARIEKTVFVSYRRTDESWALAIFQDLTQHGYDVFIDYDGIASGSFETAILENIKARAHFLVLLTPTALERCRDPKDWMRREIEAALDSQRNIVPLMLAGFNFGTPAIASQLTGKLAALKEYNGLEIPKGYFSPAMERLRNKFLSVSLDTVLHPASLSAQQAATEQKDKATMALGEALHQPWPSPEPRKQEETAAQHRAEEERRRQEAEIKQRAGEEERQRKAEAEKRRRDEEERRLQQGVTRFDNTTLRLAEAEAEEPQQLVKPWLLPLIGAGAASLPMLPTAPAYIYYHLYYYFFAFVIIYASYGGAAGFLIRRFGTRKALAIPVIPVLLLLLVPHQLFQVTSSVLVWYLGDVYRASDLLHEYGGETWIDGLAMFVPAVMCAWLAFWLYSLWTCKHQKI